VKRVLVVEDEARMRELICDYLSDEGFEVAEARHGSEALKRFARQPADAVLLDIMMPFLDGYEVCREIRRKSDAVIVMLTARSEETDKLYGYELGADDYVTKPFSLKVLVAKVKALLKRAGDAGEDEAVIRLNGFELYEQAYELRLDGRSANLTPREFELLHFLVKNRNIVLSRDMILDQVWGIDYEGDARTVDTHIKRLRREFVAGVSHDLKTPISLIGGYAEGLIDNVQDGKKRERYARIILEETARMAGMVRDMLDLSQLEAGQYQLRPEAFRLDELILRAVGKHEPTLQGKRVDLDLAPAVVYADRLRIEQVMDNLLSNAGRHAPAGGRIRVALSADGERATVRVWNEGDPIPEDELPHIWEHFYKVEKSRSRLPEPDGAGESSRPQPDGPGVSGGSGIGLSIVRQILLLHGSDYGAGNAEGGVLFYFTLKLDAAALNGPAEVWTSAAGA
jgi:DNA-binding response OmpR family regulator